ncbi:MAG: small multi-drug export protein [Erysipelotrichaceae bacterium]|nr:small multi-drug export protein [Erysipelotrichaceae bacterium]
MFKKYLIVFLVSMVPLIELRGAIPYAVVYGLPLLPSYIIAIIGNMLPVPVIFFFARKVLEWGSRSSNLKIKRFMDFFIEKGEKAKEKLLSRSKKGVYIGLFLFVGIPIPGTGAWTGTLAASFLDLEFKKSIVAVMLGVITAGIIMGLVSSGILGAFNMVF